MFSPGQIIGQWRIVKLLGEGGMAYVYEAENMSLQRVEALKVLKPQASADPSLRTRFLDEAVHAAKIVHPNVVQIYAVNTLNDLQTLMAMQIVRGPDLETLLQSRQTLSLSEAVPILEQVASALDAAHSHGVIHRDVKPANVLLEWRQQGWMAFVVDFGIARAFDQTGSRNTQAGMIVGTPEYMSPEQAEGLPDISQRSDQYSLACVAYRMLSGKSPFETSDHGSGVHTLLAHINKDAPPLKSLVPGVTSAASAAVVRALSKKPEARFATCSAFINALKSDEVVAEPPLTPPVQPPAAPQTIPFWQLATAVSVALILGTGLIAMALTSGSSKVASPPDNGQSNEVSRNQDSPTPPAQLGDEMESEPAADSTPPPELVRSEGPPPEQDDSHYLPTYWSSQVIEDMPKLRLRRLRAIPKYVRAGDEIEVWYSGKVTSAGALPVRGAVTLEVRGAATIIQTNGDLFSPPKEVAVFDGEGSSENIASAYPMTEVYLGTWRKDKEIFLKATLRVDYVSSGRSIQLLATANASWGKAKESSLINVTAPDSRSTTNQQNLGAVLAELTVTE